MYLIEKLILDHHSYNTARRQTMSDLQLFAAEYIKMCEGVFFHLLNFLASFHYPGVNTVNGVKFKVSRFRYSDSYRDNSVTRARFTLSDIHGRCGVAYNRVWVWGRPGGMLLIVQCLSDF